MKNDSRRTQLIDATIRVIGTEGIDAATTKRIGNETGINEAYIYRCFNNKVDMFVKTFEYLDELLFSKLASCTEQIKLCGNKYEIWCHFYFEPLLKFFREDSDKWNTYIQYYYSAYYETNSLDEHLKRLNVLGARMNDMFITDTNTPMLISYMVSTLMDYCYRANNRILPHKDIESQEICHMIYESIKQYLIQS